MTGTKDIFPLPVQVHSPDDPKDRFLQALCRGLNSLYGVSSAPAVEITPATSEVMKRLRVVVHGAALLDAQLCGSSFKEFFSLESFI